MGIPRSVKKIEIRKRMELTENVKYNKVVGTGGIGKGMLFYTKEMDTLGRSESRLVELSSAKDYCKQHIVLHYTAVLLGRDAVVCPIGYVGKDEPGEGLVRQMEEAGMDVQFVGQSMTDSTMISICLQYPDKEGCNFTAENNASAHVTPTYIIRCMEEIGIDARTIVAAVPEVSVESRMAMLAYGKKKGAYCVLSVPVSEAGQFEKEGAFAHCDLLAVNEEEAGAILGEEQKGRALAEALWKKLARVNPDINIAITCGKEGAYIVCNSKVERVPPLKGHAVNTTGAGDAFLGGTLAGIAFGFPLQKGREDKEFGDTLLGSAAELGTICAGMAVESKDSIATFINMGTIQEKMEEKGLEGETWFIR